MPFLFFSLYKHAKKCIYVDLNDIMTERFKLIGARKWYSFSLGSEKKMLPSNIIPIAISFADAKHYKKILKDNIHILPFNIRKSDKIEFQHKNRIGFIASDSFINRNTLSYLTCIFKEKNFLKLSDKLLIGGGIIKYATEIGCNSRIIFDDLSRPEYLRDFYSQVAVFINLVGPSSGIKTKNIEALQNGCKLITTNYGFDDSFGDVYKDKIFLVRHPIIEMELLKAINDAFECSYTEAELEHLNKKYSDKIEIAFSGIFS